MLSHRMLQDLVLRGRAFSIAPGRPLLMGIVNTTPDSFSDGGRYPDVASQRALAHELHEAGAALIDVGGESGVTHSPAVSADEEADRVIPLVEALVADGLAVSVDTWKGPVARAALEAGAVLVNDMSGLSDPGVAAACAEAGSGLVITHTTAPPKARSTPAYDNVVADVCEFLRARVQFAIEHGVLREGLIVDPGVDVSKSPATTVELLRGLGEVVALGHPLLLAVSRKDFIGALTARPPRERLAGTLAAIGAGVDAGAAIVRVHDVRAAADYLEVRAALRGDSDVRPDLALPDDLRWEGPVGPG
jgi:dihydropteroate synthase